DDDAVEAPDPQVAEPVGDPVGARRQLGEREADFPAVLLDHPEGGAVVAGSDRVEPVERPVEAPQLGPAELPVGGFVVGPQLKQEVAGPEEGVVRRVRHPRAAARFSTRPSTPSLPTDRRLKVSDTGNGEPAMLASVIAAGSSIGDLTRRAIRLKTNRLVPLTTCM